MSNFLDTKDKAFWRALLGVVSLGVSIGLAALILRLLALILGFTWNPA